MNDYEPLSTIFKLKPDRILDIAEAEKRDEERKMPLIRALQINDQIEGLLDNLDYQI